MEINAEVFLNVLNKNFGYKIKKTEFGEVLVMPAYEAFIFCTVTGSGYLENPVYPFTPKGLMKIFYNAMDYKFVSGLYDNGVLKNSPKILSDAKPYLFKGEKYILPIEFDSEAELLEIMNSIYSAMDNPQDYIIQRIERSKKGNGMEPFMEYVSGEYFRKNGYIVENQIPLAHALGSPDLGCYGSNLMFNDSKTPFESGFHIIELALLFLERRSSLKESLVKSDYLIVGEAKTSTTIMRKQLMKYLDSGLFDHGFEIHPSKQDSDDPRIGILHFDEEGLIKVKFDSKQEVFSSAIEKEEYTQWLLNYMKFYLLANFQNDELQTFLSLVSNTGEGFNSEEELVEKVKKISISDILEKILIK